MEYNILNFEMYCPHGSVNTTQSAVQTPHAAVLACGHMFLNPRLIRVTDALSDHAAEICF
jgi:hypothetical protein